MARERLRIGIVGCGDVAHRHYLPGLASMADDIEITALADPRPGAPEAIATAVADWSAGARAYADIGEMLAREPLDGVFDLTPAPLHGQVNRLVLEAGIACYSEKPIASSVADAKELIDLTRKRRVALLCAPADAVTTRFRWLRDFVATAGLGRATLAVAHHADAGPANWHEYTGDPTPFYRQGVGPVFDHGIYRLHEMTMLLGPVRRVQAMGTIAMPRRRVRGGPLRGHTIDVTTPDHVLIELELASGALGQLLASFGTLDTLAPWFELHLERGVVSFGGHSWEMDAPVSVYRDDGENGTWEHGVQIPADEFNTVESGARHFIACLLGREVPVLTAEHATHVLDVILKAYASIEDGTAHDTETTF